MDSKRVDKFNKASGGRRKGSVKDGKFKGRQMEFAGKPPRSVRSGDVRASGLQRERRAPDLGDIAGKVRSIQELKGNQQLVDAFLSGDSAVLGEVTSNPNLNLYEVLTSVKGNDGSTMLASVARGEDKDKFNGILSLISNKMSKEQFQELLKNENLAGRTTFSEIIEHGNVESLSVILGRLGAKAMDALLELLGLPNTPISQDKTDGIKIVQCMSRGPLWSVENADSVEELNHNPEFREQLLYGRMDEKRKLLNAIIKNPKLDLYKVLNSTRHEGGGTIFDDRLMGNYSDSHKMLKLLLDNLKPNELKHLVGQTLHYNVGKPYETMRKPLAYTIAHGNKVGLALIRKKLGDADTYELLCEAGVIASDRSYGGYTATKSFLPNAGIMQRKDSSVKSELGRVILDIVQNSGTLEKFDESSVKPGRY